MNYYINSEQPSKKKVIESNAFSSAAKTQTRRETPLK